jgi:hypothetical protein
MGVLDASTSPPKERYAVSKDNIIKLIQPGNVDDQLTEILRNGARALLAQAVEAEVADFLVKHADLKIADGHQRVVRHDHLPEREVMTGIGCTSNRTARAMVFKLLEATQKSWRRLDGRSDAEWMACSLGLLCCRVLPSLSVQI